MNNLLLTLSIILGTAALAADLLPVVQVEEDVYTHTNANNGAGPMWCHGSTCLVRAGEHLFASGLETLAYARTPDGQFICALADGSVQQLSRSRYEELRAHLGQPDGASHRSQPVGPETNRTSSAAGSSR